jgi:hypothetical protein
LAAVGNYGFLVSTSIAGINYFLFEQSLDLYLKSINSRYLATDDAKVILRVFYLRYKSVFISNKLGKEGGDPR